MTRNNRNYGIPVVMFKGKRFIGIWVSCAVAAEVTKIDCSSINQCCNGKMETVGGYRWEFADTSDFAEATLKMLRKNSGETIALLRESKRLKAEEKKKAATIKQPSDFQND